MSKRDNTFKHPVNVEEVIKKNIKVHAENSKLELMMDKDRQTILIKKMQELKMMFKTKLKT